MMVMSGSGERVLFVFGRPGDEALSSGGTIARLRSEGAHVAVLFGTTADPTDAVQAAMDELDVRDWRVLHADRGAETGGDRPDDAIGEVMDRIDATAIVIGAVASELKDAATQAAQHAGIPVYLATRVSEAQAERVTAIDVAEHVETKARALAAYAGRWRIDDGIVEFHDGTFFPVTGFETYVGADAPSTRSHATAAARLGGSLAAFAVGIAFGVLGTIGHQSTVTIGPITIPVGLILALVGATALLVGLRMVVGDRLVVFFCALGILGTVFLLSLRSTGGSVLIPAGLPGTVWSVAPTLVAAVVLAWPKLPARR